jgi:hypothetical protein
MPLKTVRESSNSKTGPIAVTYRAGCASTYGTCPSSCGLHPSADQGAQEIDQEYMAALLDAVPAGGQAWTYSHFAPELLPKPAPGKTVINVSADTPDQAVHAWGLGLPVTVTAPVGANLARPVVIRASGSFNALSNPAMSPAARHAVMAGHCAREVNAIM